MSGINRQSTRTLRDKSAQRRSPLPVGPLKNETPPQYIARIDNTANRTHAWMLTLRRCNDVILKMFSDGVYGGKRKALSAAVEFRDALLLQHSPFEHQVWVRARLRKNNTSGIPGVARYEVLANPRTGRREAFWLASWVNEDGASRKRKFHVSCYGERDAKRLAIAERERQLIRVCTIMAARP